MTAPVLLRVVFYLLLFGGVTVVLAPRFAWVAAVPIAEPVAFAVIRCSFARQRRRLLREAMRDGRGLVALGRTIGELREERGLSVEALATAAGIDPADLAALEAGRLDPGYHRLRHLATALGITSTALLRRVEEHDATPDGGDA